MTNAPRSQPGALDALIALARRAPEAALTTASPKALRVRLVHTLWNSDGTGGWFLTDSVSPKAREVRVDASATLAWHTDDAWALGVVTCTIDSDAKRVADSLHAVEDRSDGYEPAAFWSDRELSRLVVVDLTLDRLEVTRFTAEGPEVSRWQANVDLRTS